MWAAMIRVAELCATGRGKAGTQQPHSSKLAPYGFTSILGDGRRVPHARADRHRIVRHRSPSDTDYLGGASKTRHLPLE